MSTVEEENAKKLAVSAEDRVLPSFEVEIPFRFL
jgi:hypothetical protein